MRRYAGALQAGTIKEENLDIAAQVAAGKLDANRLVSALVRAFFDKTNRIERGCKERVNKAMNPELALEFLHTVGRGRETRQMLQCLRRSQG